jgi:hypothetical protein
MSGGPSQGRDVPFLAGGMSCQVGCGLRSVRRQAVASVVVVSDIDGAGVWLANYLVPEAPTLTYATSTRWRGHLASFGLRQGEGPGAKLETA